MCCVGIPRTTREQPVHTTFLMDRFSLSQVYIFSAGTLQGNMLGVNEPAGVCTQKHCPSIVLLECFTMNPT